MPDIMHDFVVHAPRSEVFAGVSTPDGMNQWWTRGCSGTPGEGEVFALDFGPNYQWQGVITEFQPDRVFELRLDQAAEDWAGSRVRFVLEDADGSTQVRFLHAGWSEPDEHYRISSYCWAMYLRILKRWVEHGETVAYEDRLEV